MAMQKALHDKLKELLGTEKIGDDTIVKIISGWHETNEANTVSIEKLEKANKELTEKRDASDTVDKEQKEKITTLEQSVKDKEAEIETVKEGQLTPEEKAEYLKTKKTGMTTDAEAKFNKLEKMVGELGTKLEDAEKKTVEAAEAVKNATLAEKQTALKNRIITALGEEKISGDNADFALLMMESKGLFKLTEGEDGFKEAFITKDEDGKPLEATLPELVKFVASKHENLVAASGNMGSGKNRNTDLITSKEPNPQSLAESVAKAAALMEG